MKPTPTHVEFEDTEGCGHVVRRAELSLFRGEDGRWSAFLADSDQPEPISPATAARLRRELLGEGEAAPPVVTQPGVYRDKGGWGRRIGGCDEAGWYAESPDGERGDYRWGDDGEEEDGIPAEALTERVADLDEWNLPHERDACPAELAAMLAAEPDVMDEITKPSDDDFATARRYVAPGLHQPSVREGKRARAVLRYLLAEHDARPAGRGAGEGGVVGASGGAAARLPEHEGDGGRLDPVPRAGAGAGGRVGEGLPQLRAQHRLDAQTERR